MILVCGEALIDLFVRAEDISGQQLVATIGGSSLNVASAVRKLGLGVGFAGGISTDHFGRLLEAALSSRDIDTRLTKRTVKPTPMVLVAPDALGHPSYTFYAQGTAEQALSPEDLSDELPEEFTAIALGSYTLATRPTAEAWYGLAERYGGTRVVSLDPNIRLAMIDDLASWRSQIDALAHHVSIIKMSDEDLVSGWGSIEVAERLFDNWLGRRVHLIVLTHGAGGATAWWGGGQLYRPGRTVCVQDTVGAGDTFHAALLARLAQRDLLSRSALGRLGEAAVADAVDYAIVASSITCTRRGADAPSRAEVDATLANA